MDEKTLLAFIRKTVDSSSERKARFALQQLYEILKEQQTEEKILEIAKEAADSIPEIEEIIKQNKLTTDELKIAKKRADIKRRDEQMAANHGRC